MVHRITLAASPLTRRFARPSPNGRGARLLLGVVLALFFGGAASAADTRLADAVQKRDAETAKALLKAHVDVNVPQPDGATALAWAAHHDDLEMVDLLIAAGAHVNAANDFGATPLTLACENGSAAMVEKLLRGDGNPDSALLSGETVLMTCARTGNVDAVKSLLARKPNVNAAEKRRGQTALMWAAEQKHLEVARTLIEHGANVNARSKSGFTPLLFAAQADDLKMADILIAAGADVSAATSAPSSLGPPPGTTALLMAEACGYERLGLFLLEKGADPNTTDSNGATALHYAVRKGMIMMVSDQQSFKIADLTTWHNLPELAKALLDRGAKPNAQLSRAVGRMTINTTGMTPLMLATISADVPLIKMLLANGADPSLAMKEGTTAFMLAAGVGWAARVERTEDEVRNELEATQLFLSLGADVNAAGEYKWTPLHGAAYTASNSIVQFLVDHGANIDPKDIWGQTPLSIAQGSASILIDDFTKKTQGPHPSTAALLQKLGAPPWVPPTRADVVLPPKSGKSE
jgi:uncharacterized protein